MVKQTCFRCGSEFSNTEQEAHYVRGTDMVKTEKCEVTTEKRHSNVSRAIRDRLQEEHGLNATQANMVLSRSDRNYLQDGMNHSNIDNKLETKQTADPNKPETDPEVVRVDSETVEVEDQKTGLVCANSCVHEEDEIIW